MRTVKVKLRNILPNNISFFHRHICEWTKTEQMIGQIYPTELQLNKSNSTDTEAPFLDLNLPITNGIVSSKINDKRDDFNFGIVNFPFLNGEVSRSLSYGVYISQLIRFARVCSNVDYFNSRNLLKQGYRYHKIRKDGRGLMLWLLSGPPGISFAPLSSFIYCRVFIFALSPFYILIYMF